MVPSWTLPRQESRPASSRKENGQSGLVLELEPANPECLSNGNFYNIRTVGSSLAARRSRYDSAVPVSQSPASQLPSTMCSLGQ